MNKNFTKFLAVKHINDSECLLAYSEISGRLFEPNGNPTFFSSENEVKAAVKKTREFQTENYPADSGKTKYYIYKIDFRRVL